MGVVMPEAEFMRAIGAMQELDFFYLKAAMRTIVATFLHKQPSDTWYYKRLIPNSVYSTWDPDEVMVDALEAALRGRVHEEIRAHALSRLSMLNLGESLRRKSGSQRLDNLTEILRGPSHAVSTGDSTPSTHSTSLQSYFTRPSFML